MAPKAKKGKKEPELQEPEHDPSWDRAIISGVWERSITALPDANTWPTWGALRERVLAACREINVPLSPSVRDAFTHELFRLSPPLLKSLTLRGAVHLRRLELSPAGSCPALERLDASGCPNLEYVLLQSRSLVVVDLRQCEALTKVLLQCPALSELQLGGCPALAHALIWSDALTTLDLMGSPKLVQLELQTPALQPAACRLPHVPVTPVAVKPLHPPIAAMLRENCKEAAVCVAEAKERGWREARSSSSIPAVHRPFT